MDHLSSAETAKRQDGSVVREPKAETAEAQPAPESAATVPKRESGDKLPSYVFEGYTIVHDDDGSLVVKEDRRVRNKHTGEYRDAEIETSITFTKKLTDILATGGDAAKAVIVRCDGLRRTLDGNGGVKVFFDRKRDSAKVYTKWRYELERGKPQDERIFDVPPHVLDLVRTNREYYKTDAYNEWHGPLLQRKREALISEKLAAEYPDDESALSPTEKDNLANDKKEKKEPSMEVRTMTTKQSREAFTASASMLAEKFEPLFALPEQTEKYLSYVTDFARSTFKVSFGSEMAEGESDRVVRDVLLEKYAGDQAMLSAIEKHLPEPPKATASAVEAGEGKEPSPEKNEAPDAEHMDVRDDELFSAELSAEDERSPDSLREAEAAAAAQAEYSKIRKALSDVASVPALEQRVAELENLISPDNGPVSRAAQLVLAEIELGRVGSVSEHRVAGLRRSPNELLLIESHPELDARNIRIDENDQLVAYIDRQNIDEGVKRVMRRVTNDALGGLQAAAQDEELADRIANYLKEMLLAKNQSETNRQRFAQRLASFHVTDSEIHFKDVNSLVRTVAGLAQKMKVKEKA